VIHPDTLLGRWKRAVAVAGVPEITIQEARHSYAEVALQAGARPHVVQRQLSQSMSAAHVRGKGGCHHQGVSSTRISSIHFTHQ
jgi:integrase